MSRKKIPKSTTEKSTTRYGSVLHVPSRIKKEKGFIGKSKPSEGEISP
jgi:hypothetical protein